MSSNEKSTQPLEASPAEPISPIQNVPQKTVLPLLQNPSNQPVHPELEAKEKSKVEKKSKTDRKGAIKRELICISGNFSGDMFAVCASLICNTECYVLILKEVEVVDAGSPTEKEGEIYSLSMSNEVASFFGIPLNSSDIYLAKPNARRCKADMMKEFFHYSIGKNSSRIFILPTIDIAKTYREIKSTEGRLSVKEYSYKNAKNINNETLGNFKDTVSFKEVTRSTSYLSGLQRANIVKKVRNCWDLKEKLSKVPDFFKTIIEKIPRESKDVTQQKYIIIWSRTTSKSEGGPHQQHTTGITEIAQLIKLAKAANLSVILAGDKNYITSNEQNTDEVRSRKEKVDALGKDAALDLRKIWENEKFISFAKDEQINPRLLQINLFDYLNEKFKGVTHLGWRSGNLESYTLMGHRVIYMEEYGNLQRRRQESWHPYANSEQFSIHLSSKGKEPPLESIEPNKLYLYLKEDEKNSQPSILCKIENKTKNKPSVLNIEKELLEKHSSDQEKITKIKVAFENIKRAFQSPTKDGRELTNEDKGILYEYLSEKEDIQKLEEIYISNKLCQERLILHAPSTRLGKLVQKMTREKNAGSIRGSECSVTWAARNKLSPSQQRQRLKRQDLEKESKLINYKGFIPIDLQRINRHLKIIAGEKIEVDENGCCVWNTKASHTAQSPLNSPGSAEKDVHFLESLQPVKLQELYRDGFIELSEILASSPEERANLFKHDLIEKLIITDQFSYFQLLGLCREDLTNIDIELFTYDNLNDLILKKAPNIPYRLFVYALEEGVNFTHICNQLEVDKRAKFKGLLECFLSSYIKEMKKGIDLLSSDPRGLLSSTSFNDLPLTDLPSVSNSSSSSSLSSPLTHVDSALSLSILGSPGKLTEARKLSSDSSSISLSDNGESTSQYTRPSPSAISTRLRSRSDGLPVLSVSNSPSNKSLSSSPVVPQSAIPATSRAKSLSRVKRSLSSVSLPDCSNSMSVTGSDSASPILTPSLFPEGLLGSTKFPSSSSSLNLSIGTPHDASDSGISDSFDSALITSNSDDSLQADQENDPLLEEILKKLIDNSEEVSLPDESNPLPSNSSLNNKPFSSSCASSRGLPDASYSSARQPPSPSARLGVPPALTAEQLADLKTLGINIADETFIQVIRADLIQLENIYANLYLESENKPIDASKLAYQRLHDSFAKLADTKTIEKIINNDLMVFNLTAATAKSEQLLAAYKKLWEQALLQGRQPSIAETDSYVRLCQFDKFRFLPPPHIVDEQAKQSLMEANEKQAEELAKQLAQAAATKYNLTLQNVSNKGNCFFDSVSDQLQHRYGVAIGADHLRLITMLQMQRNPDRYVEHISAGQDFSFRHVATGTLNRIKHFIDTRDARNTVYAETLPRNIIIEDVFARPIDDIFNYCRRYSNATSTAILTYIVFPLLNSAEKIAAHANAMLENVEKVLDDRTWADDVDILAMSDALGISIISVQPIREVPAPLATNNSSSTNSSSSASHNAAAIEVETTIHYYNQNSTSPPIVVVFSGKNHYQSLRGETASVSAAAQTALWPKIGLGLMPLTVEQFRQLAEKSLKSLTQVKMIFDSLSASRKSDKKEDKKHEIGSEHPQQSETSSETNNPKTSTTHWHPPKVSSRQTSSLSIETTSSIQRQSTSSVTSPSPVDFMTSPRPSNTTFSSSNSGNAAGPSQVNIILPASPLSASRPNKFPSTSNSSPRLSSGTNQPTAHVSPQQIGSPDAKEHEQKTASYGKFFPTINRKDFNVQNKQKNEGDFQAHPLLSDLHQLIDAVYPLTRKSKKDKRDSYIQQLEKYKNPAYTITPEDLAALEKLKRKFLQKQSKKGKPSCIIS